MTSIIERAWGFAESDYVDALNLIHSRPEAIQIARGLFARLEANPDHSIGGEEDLFALLSLLSSATAIRVQTITQWTESEMLSHQAIVLAKRKP